AARGNELGWHPHLYEKRVDPSGDERYFPIRDEAAACEQIVSTFRAIGRAGLAFESVRIGEAWHASRAMCTLDTLGLRVDSTAIPGRSRNDDVLSFDWRPTPAQPYHPSRKDHRVPAAPGSEESLAILEIPMTTVPIRADYDREPLARYLNLAF